MRVFIFNLLSYLVYICIRSFGNDSFFVGLDVMRKIQKLKNQHTVIIITHFCYIHSDICNLYFLFWMICWQKNKNYRAFVTPKIPRRAMWCVCVFFLKML